MSERKRAKIFQYVRSLKNQDFVNGSFLRYERRRKRKIKIREGIIIKLLNCKDGKSVSKFTILGKRKRRSEERRRTEN